MLAQQFGDGVPDATEADDDGAAFRRFVTLRVARAHLDPPRDIVTDTREQRRDRQPDRGDELPEFGSAPADELRLQGGRQHDQGGFRRARHQQPDLGSRAAPRRARKAQKRGGDERFDKHDTDDRDGKRWPLFGDRLEVEPHADADQEHPEREPLERRGDRLDLVMIFGFGNHQPREQRPDDR